MAGIDRRSPCAGRCARALLFVVAAASMVAAAPAFAFADPACTRKTFDDDAFLVCPFDLRTEELRIVSTDAVGEPLRDFDALAEALGPWKVHVRFAMNAGMFDEAGHPIGLLVENGIERHAINTAKGPGNFHMMPNGVFSLDGEGVLRVETTKAFVSRGVRPLWATQSGPMLVIKGRLHPQISHDGPSRRIRNGVGIKSQRSAFFVISEDAVSFGKFARFFRDRLACRSALYFDGSVSSLWAPSLERKETGFLLGPMVVVLNR